MKFLKFSLIIILLNSCANSIVLTGGKDDTEAPILLKKNYDSQNFNQKKIELKFNEYVTLNQPEKNITLQPAHSTLKFKIIQKSVIIELDSLLKNNTTYVLTIDKGIQDNNANNSFTYTSVFSTGKSLDTGEIKINLKDDVSQYKNIKIALTKSNGLDSFKTFKADYIFPVKNNQIDFKGLSKTSYNIYLFTDDDNNNIPDVFKPIDFYLNALIDSNYTLSLKEWKKPLYIKKISTSNNIVKCLINQTVLNLDSTILKQQFDVDFNDIIYLTPDSFTIYLNHEKKERFIQYNHLIKQKIDTSWKYTIDESYNLINQSIQIIKRKKDYIIHYKNPKSTLLESIILNKIDSILIIKNDTFNIKNNSIKDYKNLSFLDFKINSNKKYDINFYQDKKLVFIRKNNNQIKDYFAPGKYEIKILENDTENPNNPFENKNGPKIILIKEIILKANWDEVLTLNL